MFSRLEHIITTEGLKILKTTTVAVVGIGGVGGVSAEVLVRSGLGNLIIQDYDKIEKSNINRQIIANTKSIGNLKVDELTTKLLSINPDCNIVKIPLKYHQDEEMNIFKFNPDFVIDAIDDINGKHLLIKECLNNNINFVSSMGAAKKISPYNIMVADLKKTSYDPIAKILRRKLRGENKKHLIPVIYSKEEPQTIPELGSYMPVTASFGIIAAHYCIMEILKKGGITL